MRKLPRVVYLVGLSVILSAHNAAPVCWWEMEEQFSAPEWTSVGEVQLSYYNFCTGWAWLWACWEADERAGVVFDSDCPPGETATLVDSRIFCDEPWAFPGYGFTGTVSVHEVDANSCPVDPPLDSQSWLPRGGDNEFVWNTPVGEKFAIVATFATPAAGMSNPTVLVSDHPARGPWGYTACGYCYPTSRANHSFYYSDGSLCAPFYDGVCDAQLLFDAGLNYTVHTEHSTWGGIKALYR